MLEREKDENPWQWNQKMNEEENQLSLSEENLAAFDFLAKHMKTDVNRKCISTSAFLLNVESIFVWKCITALEM